MSTLRALSLWNPHAGLMAIGAKGVESRPRTFGHRGPLAIASTAGIPAGKFRRWAQDVCREQPFRDVLAAEGWHRLEDMPSGCIVALVWVDAEAKVSGDMMRAAIRETYGKNELAFGHYVDGRVAIHTDRARLIRLREPVPCKGGQGLWTVPYQQLGLLAAQLRAHPHFHHYRDVFGALADDTSQPLTPPTAAPPGEAPPTTNPPN